MAKKVVAEKPKKIIEEPREKPLEESQIASSFKIKSIIPILIFLTILVLASVPAYYFYNQYEKTKKLLQNPDAAAKEELKATVEKVGKLMDLPKEQPTLATVSDKTKLKDQPFFANSQNGDQVLLYTEKKIAILYRPSINKIIAVAPIDIGEPAAPKEIKVSIYNGTTTAGLANTAEKQLKEKIKEIQVVSKENAKKRDYKKNIVVDIKGENADMAQQLATLMNGEVATLPEGESKPEADFLIILGSE